MLRISIIYLLLHFSGISFTQNSITIDTVYSNESLANCAFTEKQLLCVIKSKANLDSLLNLIAYVSELELKKESRNIVISTIVQNLMTLNSDTCFRVILDNITINSYINYTNAIDLYKKQKQYPVLKAIEHSTAKNITLLKDYILYSDYLNNEFTTEEIMILNYILLGHDPTYRVKVTNDGSDTPRSRNIQSIVNYKLN